MTTLAPTARGLPATPATARPAPRHLWGPLADFLLLGGISLLLLPIALALPSGAHRDVGIAMVIIALVVNHPHFAHSYQAFYRGFSDKLHSPNYRSGLRLRYAFAGLAVPAILALTLVAAVASRDPAVLGWIGATMGFFVGWHYIKQGYGMLIVEGALHGQHFRPTEKHVLLANAYAAWALTWIGLNTSGSEPIELLGVDYYMFGLPTILETAAAVIAAATTAATAAVLLARLRTGKSLPIAGLTAYLVTLYLWMIFVRIDPIWLLMVPALHSLQYLAVVWRFEANRMRAQPGAAGLPRGELRRRFFRQTWQASFSGVLLAAFVIGLLGFWLVPLLLEAAVPPILAGTPVFLFAFWIFINIHHYFIDNVIWRRENPEIQQYLFAPPPRA